MDGVAKLDEIDLALASARETPTITLDYYPPPPGLIGLVTTFYNFRHESPQIRDIQPAAVGHMIIFLKGRGEMIFKGDRSYPITPASLLAPGSCAARIEMEGPLENIGAALSPLGWATFTGLHAGQHSDRLIPASSVFGAEIEALAREIAEGRRAGLEPAALCDRLGQFLLRRAKLPNPRHLKLLKAVAHWLGSSLDPSTDELYAAVPYSPRQAQRLIERYFGLPPRELKRKYRAIRAATLMALDNPSEADLVATAELFADQSHMIREIRHFVGRTPGKLSEEGDSLLTRLLDIRNFREVKPQVAPMPEGIGKPSAIAEKA